MQEHEHLHIYYLSIFSSLFRESQNLFFTYKSLTNNLQSLCSDMEWYDPKEGRENKYRMKDLGALLSQYKQSINTTLIFLIEKSTEDIIYQLRSNPISKKIDFWTACKTCVFANEVTTLRHLNNCLKHNSGIVDDNSAPGKFLLKNGYRLNDRIEYLEFDFEDLIYKSYHFNLDLLCQSCSKEFKVTEKQHFIKYIIPEFIHNQL